VRADNAAAVYGEYSGNIEFTNYRVTAFRSSAVLSVRRLPRTEESNCDEGTSRA
jgi:hypothetical protein